MPNWCYTVIDFYGNKKDVTCLNDLINKWTSKENSLQNDFGENWLVNVVVNSGIRTYEQLMNNDGLRCRGRIVYQELSEDESNPYHLRIDTETAWVPMIVMWREVLEKYKLNLELIYNAEEPGCELYMTNDPVLNNCYSIEISDEVKNIEIYSDEGTKEDIIAIAREKFGINEQMELDKLIDKMSDIAEEDDGFVVIREWEFCDVGDIEY